VDDIAVDGREAERLLNDATLKKVFAKLEEQYVSQWIIAKSKDDREKLHSNVTGLRDIRASLETMKQTKALAESENRRFGRTPK
jgi:hypothetical protein